jgi:serine/threonine protein phosphatase 1
MKNVTVIGDIHGTYKTFLALLEKIPAGDQIVLVGDLVDRGPQSKQVVQYLIDHPEIKCVKANHEDMMCTDILKLETPYQGEWLVFQGAKTLDSYRRDDYSIDYPLMHSHCEYLKTLPYYIEFPYAIKDDRYLVVSHASIGSTWKFRDPGHENHHFFTTEVMWNRNKPDDIDGVYNIFGHTPRDDGPIIKSYYANVDTGACLKRDYSELYGKLTALRFPSMEVIQQENIDW